MTLCLRLSRASFNAVSDMSTPKTCILRCFSERSACSNRDIHPVPEQISRTFKSPCLASTGFWRRSLAMWEVYASVSGLIQYQVNYQKHEKATDLGINTP